MNNADLIKRAKTSVLIASIYGDREILRELIDAPRAAENRPVDWRVRRFTEKEHDK
jgi:hypothetical protein